MIAVLDIGSNSVRLMLWADGKSLFKKVSTTRLGEGLASSGHLSEAAMERTIGAVKAFCTQARAYDATIYAFATAAVRSSQNGEELCDRIKGECGVSVDVVSGEEEAILGLTGAVPPGEDGGIVDIGGASTEICCRKAGEILFRTSLPVGCVKLFDRFGDRRDALEEAIGRAIGPLTGVLPSGTAYAVGGTASTLASVKLGLSAYDAVDLQDLPLGIEWMRETADRLLSCTKEERMQIPGMDRARADIIAGGALLLHKIMEKLQLSEVRFSDRDNLEGYLHARGLG